MADVIRDGMSWLAGQMKSSASSPCVYAQGASTYETEAVYESYQSNVQDPSGMTYLQFVHDFVFHADDLPVDPKQGDTITAYGKVYEVSRESFEAASRVSNAHGYQIRIHTQYIGAAE